MPLNASAVGTELRPLTAHVDSRWLMAYAAGLGHRDPAYFDTTRAAGPVNHPLFPIAVEWGLIIDPGSGLQGALGISPAERLLAVHARHDLHLHRPIRPGTDVTVCAQVVGIEHTPPGGLLTMRLRGADGDGPLWTTWMGSLYRGLTVAGADQLAETFPAPPRAPVTGDADVSPGTAIPVELWAPHVYSECSRIWNPIHTDLAVARAAGLPGVILHGSANLAHGVDAVLTALGVGPERVARVGGSFRATVAVPSSIRPALTSVAQATDGTITAHFTVLNAAGRPAVHDGFVVIDPGKT